MRNYSSFCAVKLADALSKTRFGLLKNTGDEIAGATGTDVTLRAERKLGGSAEALAPHTLRSVFIPFGGPLRAMVTPFRSRLGTPGLSGGRLHQNRI